MKRVTLEAIAGDQLDIMEFPNVLFLSLVSQESLVQNLKLAFSVFTAKQFCSKKTQLHKNKVYIGFFLASKVLPTVHAFG